MTGKVAVEIRWQQENNEVTSFSIVMTVKKSSLNKILNLEDAVRLVLVE